MNVSDVSSSLSNRRASASERDGRSTQTTDDVVVVSNRQPYRHEYDDEGGINVSRPTGGLTSALDAAMRERNGTWIAWGDGSADRDVVDDEGHVTVPPDEEEGTYTLNRVWLSDEQVENYYLGFSNRVLWPVCHSMLMNVHSEAAYWQNYEAVNDQFVDNVARHVGESTIVWFQDYHLSLAPRMLESRVPDGAFLAHFWHIPWPGWDMFRACPHGEEIIAGLLGNDLLGFHVPRYGENFMECVEQTLPDADVDRDAAEITFRGKTTTIKAFPLGVSVDTIRTGAKSEAAESFWSEFADEHHLDEKRVSVGVDRLDYTKGIPERFEALERLWEDSPEWRGALTHVQIGSKSRSEIEEYMDIQTEVEEEAARINERFGTDEWEPIVYTTAHLSDEALYGAYRHGDIALVSPLRDGMNLVAQEYVAAQGDDDDAVLLLSDQTGAHDYMGEWTVTVRPQNTDEFASAIDDALRMPASERRERMRELRNRVEDADVSRWMHSVFETIAEMQTAGTGGSDGE
ncbi:alpha,alpha-trehalose-phosphate synthase (UDP-forming) [Halopelagius longus]|uniref:Trehalose-6-phosphate synthase n=1 Tax=Halopelagius longus TaxID=1236180 RepID=A0A1H0YLC8_9EURY|nr:trehalose-6-phosphate synthase [Halopelagius longus]RDI72553.1 trehalose-6-phosphate synthase [Halopelagius longus]SDQ15995.1 trehalose 6-phosphate synthase [Halopelagius longus]